MQFLITLEETESGFSVQVPDLAILTHGESVNAAKQAAVEAIGVNLNAYKELDMRVPPAKSFSTHFENSDYNDLLFAFVNVSVAKENEAA